MSSQIHLEYPGKSRHALRFAKICLFNFLFILTFCIGKVSAANAPVITSSKTASGKVGTAFSYQLTATNSPTSFGATGLPAGITLKKGTGLISGTPTVAGTSTVTLSATNSGGSGKATLTLNMAPATPVINSATTASGTTGSAFSYQITATNSPTSYGATGLPAGLAVSSATGLISGTPTAAGTSTVTLSATNSGGTGSATLTLTISLAAPVITSATTASVRVGSAVSYAIAASGTPTSYGATGLPAGLSVSSATGLISGTPTSTGTSTVTLSATNTAGTGTATLTLTIAAPLPAPFAQYIANKNRAIPTSMPLAFAARTSAGDLLLVALAYDVSSATASVSDSQGNIFTPVGSQLTTPGGQFTQVFYAPNIKGGADTVTVTLSANSTYLDVYLTEYAGINPTNPIDAQASASGSPGAVSSGNATTTVAGDVIYGYCLGDPFCGTAGSGFATRSTFDGDLVEDMLAGSPGSYAATGSAAGNWAMQMVALKPATVVPSPVITSATTASGTAGSAFSYQITATNAPTSYGATGLPAGLSVNTGTGLISGTPTAAGTSTVTLSATNSTGTGNATLTLTIAVPPPIITSATTASGTTGSAFSYQITAANSPSSYGATGLPAGLAVNSATGLISGTPTAAGTSTVALSATNSGGTGSATLTLTIAVAAPVITSATTATATVGSAFSYQITATNSPAGYAATGLPAGLSVNSATGLISGTPTAAGDPAVTLSATNSTGTGNATLTLTIAVPPPIITSATTASGTTGSAFSYQITATNSPTSYGATGLPAGLAVNSTTGLISGTPTAAGTSTVTLSATNSGGTGSATLTLAITGTGSGTTVSVSPATLAFGNCPADVPCSSQTVTLNNTGSSTVNISSITFTGADPADFSENNTCNSSLAAGGSCNIVVLFTPSATGTRTASLTITDNASGSPQSAALSGTGTHDIVLNWNASPTPGIDGYYIYRGTSSGGESSTPLNTVPINGTTYTDANVAAGATYYYLVTTVASNGVTQSADSNETSATVPSP